MQTYDNEALSAGLLDFIKRSPSAFHTVDTVKNILKEHGFSELFEGDVWKSEKGKGYFVSKNGSSVIAFTVPESGITGFNIAASHSDFPCYKLKDNCELSGNDFVRINAETYGGLICSTWLDRPLSVAGRIAVETENGIETKLVNIDRDLLLIPNVAIHMNRTVNTGFNYNPSVDTVPLFALGKEHREMLDIVADEAGVEKSKILGSDLFIYSRTPASVWGTGNEFISSRSLDDLQCAFSSLMGFLRAERSSCMPVFACFDNEEVGSQSKQGAGSAFLSDTLLRICEASGGDYRRMLSSSFLLSCDNAHAVHPNHPEYADPVNKVRLGGGVVIKFNASQRYTTDSVSEAVVKLLCKRNDIPYQCYTNRSDMAGGSTLGGIATTKVPVNSADVGLAQLAMHSSYETASVSDTAAMVELCRVFFSSPILTNGSNNYQF